TRMNAGKAILMSFRSHFYLMTLDAIHVSQVLGFAAAPPDVREVSDLPRTANYLSWAMPQVPGRSPNRLYCPADGGAEPPSHIGRLSRAIRSFIDRPYIATDTRP